MRKLLTLILCFSLLLLSGCGPTVADIQKYEKENNAVKIIEPLNKLLDPRSNEKIQDAHVAAVSALIRMAPTNSDAEKFLEWNYSRFDKYDQTRGIIAPYGFKRHIKKLGQSSISNTRDDAGYAKKYASAGDSEAVAMLDKIIKKCDSWEKLDKRYDEDMKVILGEYESVRAIENVIEQNKDNAGYIFATIVKKVGFNARNSKYFSKEEAMNLIVAAVSVNPDLQALALSHESYIKENNKLQSKINGFYRLKGYKEISTGNYSREIAADISKLQKLVLNESYERGTNTTTANTNTQKQEYGYISGSDVNVRKSPNTQATVIDCLANDTKVEILDYMHVQGPYNWYKIRLSDGRIGYVAHLYIRK